MDLLYNMCYICYGQRYRDLALNVLVASGHCKYTSIVSWFPFCSILPILFLLYSRNSVLLLFPSWFSYSKFNKMYSMGRKEFKFSWFLLWYEESLFSGETIISFGKSHCLNTKLSPTFLFSLNPCQQGIEYVIISLSWILPYYSILWDKTFRNIFSKILYIFKQFKILGKKHKKVTFSNKSSGGIKWIGQGTKWFSWTCKKCNACIIFDGMFIQKNVHLC